MSVPRVVLDGDWPPNSPGYSHIPPALTTDHRLSLAAFAVCAYLITLANDPIHSPDPADVAAAQLLPLRTVKYAYTQLVSTGWLVLILNDDATVAEYRIRSSAGGA